MGSGKRSRGQAPGISGRSSRWSIGALRATTCHVVASIEVERPGTRTTASIPHVPTAIVHQRSSGGLEAGSSIARVLELSVPCGAG